MGLRAGLVEAQKRLHCLSILGHDELSARVTKACAAVESAFLASLRCVPSSNKFQRDISVH